jgi:TrmH family RNA methyltransferase
MISKNSLISYSRLLKKKFRQEQRKFIVEGIKTIQEGINSNFKCEIIFATNNFKEANNKIISELIKKNLRVEIIKNIDFQKLCSMVNPQGISAVFLFPDFNKKKIEEDSSNLIVCLENISDPGNLGTIIRNCDWFGIKEIILSKNCSDVFSPKTIRASMGSIFHLTIYEDVDLSTTLALFKNKDYKITCADLDGENIFGYKKSEKEVIVFANEANGPSNYLLSVSDNRITIPKFGKAESLNVASASAIILAELTR